MQLSYSIVGVAKASSECVCRVLLIMILPADKGKSTVGLDFDRSKHRKYTQLPLDVLATSMITENTQHLMI